MRLLLAIVALALAAPTAASAADTAGWTPPTDEALLAASLPVARAAWPDSPCTGREVIHLRADNALDAFDRLYGEASVARAGQETCEVWIRAGQDNGFCLVLVHELGHLAGYVHPDEDGPHPADPVLAAVMGEGPNRRLAACDAVNRSFPFDPPHHPAAQAMWTVWWRLPPRLWDQARVHCGRAHCVMWVAGFRTRRYRFDAASGVVRGPVYLPLR